ncbi:Cytochrome c oxidase subunit 5B, mitochondrial [Hondaea fermentalgiana]|uniref:Cytochrome c oxidase subunit 5B, mitochondrial n=1 Tax=Hondaea fermentalgiana TaxID=2315210 RepID=A0A2R5GN59_9STRA|nr:Cytochrome c oxidase subunit 5B, mitochondrial [Hondaea fermentalgiana]|eukprot:GBG32342.1 Cytochrome c oxidase subunit 5B, mitochondrial [Hondaea fermentalgiana]
MLRVAGSRTMRLGARMQVRGLAGYKQPPLSQGPGGKPEVIADDAEQATGREREELKAFAEGKEYFNRQPIQMEKGQGSFENPIMVPSEMHERTVGMIPKGQDGPIWFNITAGEVNYVPELNVHFKLYNPMA